MRASVSPQQHKEELAKILRDYKNELTALRDKQKALFVEQEILKEMQEE